MSNSETSALTGLAQIDAERLAYLERDRWPEFERELKRRRLRIAHFDVHHYGDGKQPWEWLIWRCRNWGEVERVLNRHRVNWERRKRHEIVMEGMSIYRCR